MPPDLTLDGEVTLTLRSGEKSTKVILKVIGQRTSAGVVHLQTDAGLDLPLGERCILTTSRDAPPKQSQAEVETLVQDALANPSPEKLYRLTQFLARE